ncbi:hypothetical protein [Brevundimonas sp.]|uniref:hypothetical protein n=1 Tax=Brevundimonas sp. TaxID=1871086 RepID=UPI002FC76C39
MTLRRLLLVVLILGMAALGAPAPALATPVHHLPPADCGSSGPDETVPACVQTCLSRPLCPPAPALVAPPVPAMARTHGLKPVDDRLAGRLIGPEPPPPRT